MTDAVSQRVTDTFTKFIMTTLAGLLAAGIGGLWQMSGNLARLEERVSALSVTTEKTLVATQSDIKDTVRRVTALEITYRRSDPSPDREPDYPRRDIIAPKGYKDERRGDLR